MAYIYHWHDYRTQEQKERDWAFGRKFDITYNILQEMKQFKKQIKSDAWKKGIVFRFTFKKQFDEFLMEKGYSPYLEEYSSIYRNWKELEEKDLRDRLNRLFNRMKKEWNEFISLR